MSAGFMDLARLGDVYFLAPERAWFAVPVGLVLLLVPVLRRRGGAARPLVARGLVMAALLAVVLEPAVDDKERRTGRLLALADVSPSVGPGGRERARRYLESAEAPFELVAFGATPVRTGKGLFEGALAADPRDATDLAAALRFAAVRADTDVPLRVVLLSDGRPTVPGAESAALLLRHQGAELYALTIPEKGAPDRASLTALGLDLPPLERRREPFPLEARVHADVAADATAWLYINGQPHGKVDRALEPGENKVVFSNLTLPPGHHYAQVLFGPDASPHDSITGAPLEVPGVPRVLCLAGKRRKSLIANALTTQGLEADVAAAADDIDLAAYDAVVLLPDAPADRLERHATALAEFVGRRGGGLVAIGGTDGEGLARFHGTPIAFLLPLAVEPRPRQEEAPPTPKPSEKPRIEIVEEKTQAYPISLCLVIDRSGSMQGYKMQQAKVATVHASRTLTPADRISLVAFGNEAIVLMSPRPADDGRRIVGAVDALFGEGRTALFAALETAYKLLKEDASPIRHMIVISDGRPTDAGRWRDLVTAMAREKITVSSVGIGMDVDGHLLGKLAQWGHGKYWLARAHEIPQVVTQDTLRIVSARNRRGKDAEQAPPDEKKDPEPPPKEPPQQEPEPPPPPVAQEIVPEPGAPRDMLKGLPDDELPRVAGVEEGKPRFASWIAARAGEKGPPLLAYWRVGLGTAAAFTVDPEGPSGRELAEHEEFARLMAQLLRSVLPDTTGEAYVLKGALQVRGATEVASLRIVAEDGLPRTDLPVAVQLEDGRALDVRRRADRYEAALPGRAGPTRITVRLGPAESPLLERTFLLPPSTNREMARTGPDRATLLRLVGEGTHLDATAAATFVRPTVERTRMRPLWLPFLFFAAILLPFDAWARRRLRSASR